MPATKNAAQPLQLQSSRPFRQGVQVHVRINGRLAPSGHFGHGDAAEFGEVRFTDLRMAQIEIRR